MDLFSVLLIAVALAMDAFSVCLSAGMIIPSPTARHYFRLSFHFGLFQFLMPLAGYWAGVLLESFIQAYDHWVAFALLLFIGGRMMHEALSGDDDERETRDPSRGMSLVMLSVATSIDALAVGIMFGVLKQPVLLPAAVIGAVCAAFSAAGIYLGKWAGRLIGSRAAAIGGAVLILLGVKILAEHLGFF